MTLVARLGQYLNILMRKGRGDRSFLVGYGWQLGDWDGLSGGGEVVAIFNIVDVWGILLKGSV